MSQTPQADATLYLIDPSTTGFGSDGSGPWDTTTPIWFNGTTTADSAYSTNSTSDIADFGAGSAGSYSVNVASGGINVGTINFLNGNYTLTGGPLTMGSPAAISTVGNNAISSNITGAGNLTLTGAGLLSLSGSDVFTGSVSMPTAANTTTTLNVSSGVLAGGVAGTNTGGGFFIATSNTSSGAAVVNLTGGTISSNFYFSVGQYGKGTLNISAGSATSEGDFNIGNQAGSVGIVNLSGTGSIAVSSPDIGSRSTGNLVLGQGNSAGIVNQTGGSVTVANSGDKINIAQDPTSVGAWMISAGTITNAATMYCSGAGYGAMYVSGTGSVVDNNYVRIGGSFNTTLTNGILDVSGGTFNQSSLSKALTVGEVNNASLNIRGSGTVYSGALYIGGGETGTSQGNGTGLVNLLPGGTLITGVVGTNANGTKFFNFDGGTLAPIAGSGSLGSFMNSSSLTAVVYSGGAVIDTTNASLTIAQKLNAPGGSGVSSIAVSGGTGYLAPPVVSFSGGGGTGASGVATIDANGNLTGIIITNPGQNYTTAPSISITGATLSGNTTSTTIASASIAADVSGGLTKNGANTLTLSSNASNFTGNVNINAGTLIANSGNGSSTGPLGSTTVARTVNVGTSTGSTATLNLAGGDVLGPGGGTASSCQVSVVVNNGSTFAITTTGQGNSIQNLTLNGGAVVTSTGYSVQYPTLNIGGNVTVGGSVASTIFGATGSNNNINLGLTGSSAAVNFNVADVTGSVAPDLSISVPLGGRSGAATSTNSGILTKSGAGTLALSGSSFYSGGTTITAGTLQANAQRVLSGTTLATSSTGIGTVTINGGVLAGTGGVGAVIVNSGGTITAGSGATSADTIGTLNTGNQTWNAGGSYVAKIASVTSPVSNDDLIMTGLTIGATSTAGQQYNIDALGTGSSTLTLPVSTTLILAQDSEAAGTNPFNGSSQLAIMSLAANQITAPSGYILKLGTEPDPTVNGVYDLTLSDVAKPTALTYTGATNNAFDTLTVNFTSSAGPTDFANGNSVTFDDTAQGNFNVAVAAAGVSPNALMFNNSSHAYSFSGGPITGASLLETGGGIVTLNGSAAFTGNVNVSNGTLVIGSGGSIAATNLLVGTSGTFSVLSGGQVVVPFNIVDSGTVNLSNAATSLLALTGSGTVNLNGTALTVGAGTSFSGSFGGVGGSLNISSGNVAPPNAAAFSGLTGGITVGAGTLVVPGGSLAGIANGTPITVTLGPGSTLETADGATAMFAGNINVTAPTSITAGPTNISSSTLTLTGNISGTGPVNFAGTGTSTVVLAGSANYTGETRLPGDGVAGDHETLQLGANNGMSINSGLAITGTINSQLTADLHGFSQSVTYLAGVAGVNNQITSSTGSSVLTISNGNNGSSPAVTTTPITGAISIVKTGAGNQQLLGTSNFAGGATITNGTLTVGAAAALGTGAVTLNGGTLQLGVQGNSSINGFSAFTTNGGANTSGGTLNLTADSGIQAVSAFSTSPQTIGNAGFVASFTYTDTHASQFPGDGFAFVIQNDTRGSTAVGGPGGALGYGNNGSSQFTAIGNSAAADFNLYFAYTPGVGFSTNGAVPGTFTSTSPVDLTDGNPHQITLTYNAPSSTLTESIVDNGNTFTTTYSNVNYSQLLGGLTGYVGFTAGTYAATAAQSISNFSFSTVNSPVSIANAVASTTGTTSTITFPVSPTVTSASIGSLTIPSGSTVKISSINNAGNAGTGVLEIPSLSISGTLDIQTNDLDLPSADLGTITALVKSGLNAGAGYFNGTGIISSAAADDPTFLYAIGVISNNDNGTAIYSATNLFDSTAPGLNDVLVKYTYYGDANLDGHVDGSDYTLIDNGYNNHLTGWLNGDFNYDGVVDGSDYTLIDNAFNTQGSPQGASSNALFAASTAQFGATSVPEPATIFLLPICSAMLLRRRRQI